MNTFLIFAVIFLSLLVAMLIIAFFALSRQVGVLFERITPVGAMMNNSGPAIGDTTPSLSVSSMHHGEMVIGGQRQGYQLILFVAPGCPICKALFPVVRNLRKSEGHWLSVVLASDGDVRQHQNFIVQEALTAIPYVLSWELGMTWKVARLPFSVLLDENGTVVSKGLINNREQLESLFNAKESGFDSLQSWAQSTSAGH